MVSVSSVKHRIIAGGVDTVQTLLVSGYMLARNLIVNAKMLTSVYSIQLVSKKGKSCGLSQVGICLGVNSSC